MSFAVSQLDGPSASVLVKVEKSIAEAMALLIAEMERSGLEVEASTFNRSCCDCD